MGAPPTERPKSALLVRRGLALVALVTAIATALISFLHQSVEFLLLITGENRADLRIGVAAHLLELRMFVFARHRLVLHERLHLILTIAQDRFHFGLLVFGEVQLVRQHLGLLVGVHATTAAAAAAIPHAPALIVSALHRRLPILISLCRR